MNDCLKYYPVSGEDFEEEDCRQNPRVHQGQRGFIKSGRRQKYLFCSKINF